VGNTPPTVKLSEGALGVGCGAGLVQLLLDRSASTPPATHFLPGASTHFLAVDTFPGRRHISC
jgi:hypothetical protein